MISVAEALRRTLDGVTPLERDHVLPLGRAIGSVLAEHVVASRDQPPFDASAMDGYAVRSTDAAAGAELRVVGESKAGRRYGEEIETGEAVRIFTGAPIPAGADAILIQEDASRRGNMVTVREGVTPGRYVRPRGRDFAQGALLAEVGRTVDAGMATLLATAGHSEIRVRQRPSVAVLSTGDELVALGEEAGSDQIVASSVYGVIEILRRAGADAFDGGIARDTRASLTERLDEKRTSKADLIVTLGGASVGDHDLVRPVFAERGIDLAFEKVAMRPGKPLMHGRDGKRLYLGLPGNPVSSLVCARIFGQPLVARLAGRAHRHGWRDAVLGRDVPANDRREEFMRAVLSDGPKPVAVPFERQDSSLVSIYAGSNALLHREANAPAAKAGDPCRVICLQPSNIY